jgi:hypothetical protein
VPDINIAESATPRSKFLKVPSCIFIYAIHFHIAVQRAITIKACCNAVIRRIPALMR